MVNALKFKIANALILVGILSISILFVKNRGRGLLNGQNALSVTKVISRQSLSAIQKKKRKRSAPVKKGDVSVVVKRSNLLCDCAGTSRTFLGNEEKKINRQVVVAINVP